MNNDIVNWIHLLLLALTYIAASVFSIMYDDHENDNGDHLL